MLRRISNKPPSCSVPCMELKGDVHVKEVTLLTHKHRTTLHLLMGWKLQAELYQCKPGIWPSDFHRMIAISCSGTSGSCATDWVKSCSSGQDPSPFLPHKVFLHRGVFCCKPLNGTFGSFTQSTFENKLLFRHYFVAFSSYTFFPPKIQGNSITFCN